jgi:hypothetical protein
MAFTTDNGIVSTPSHHSVDQTLERLKTILQAKAVPLFALIDHSGEAEKSWNKNETHQTADLWQSQSGNSIDAGSPEHRHRSSSQSSGLGRRLKQGLDFLQQPTVTAETTRFPQRAGAKRSAGRNLGERSRRVMQSAAASCSARRFGNMYNSLRPRITSSG